MRKNFFKETIYNITMFVPWAFKRYTITFALAILVITMTVFSFFSGPSKVQLLQKQEPRSPAEYQITLSAPKLEKTYEDLWVNGVTALLKQNDFECYTWMYKGRRVIDVLGIFNKEGDIQQINTLLQRNGLIKEDITIESAVIAERIDTYDIEFEAEDMASSDKQTWGKAVGQLLFNKGYVVAAVDSGNVMIQHVSYPPFKEAYNMIAFIEEGGLKSPSAFSIYENDPLDGFSDDLLFRIEESHHAIRMAGFVPLKKYDPEVHHEKSIFIVKVVNPEGNISVANIMTHPVTGFALRYPQDFVSQDNNVLKGSYQVKCFLNDRNVLNAKFQLDEVYAIIGLHDIEPKRVFYSQLQ